jgi:curved DNA-binding protein CbpA
MKSEQDLYFILGIAPTASISEVRQAYRKLAFEYHPDRNLRNPEATAKMGEINEAYAIISDPVRRKEYDTPRGYNAITPKFNKGTRVTISPNSSTPYRGHAGVVDAEPVKDTFRFWYMVKLESGGMVTSARFPEEELVEAAM